MFLITMRHPVGVCGRITLHIKEQPRVQSTEHKWIFGLKESLKTVS